jgi:hypothetical protein
MERKEIKIGKIEIVKLKDIEFIKGNRDVLDRHINKFSNLIDKYGFLVVPTAIKKNNKYLILEGQHRKNALELLGVTEIPVYIIDWINPENFEEIQDTMISINAHNMKWRLFDYISSYAENINKNNYREYLKLKNLIIKNRAYLSEGVIASIYDGILRSHNNIRIGKLNFINETFSDKMLNTFVDLVKKYGKKKFTANFQKHLASSILKNDDRYNLLQKSIHAIDYHFAIHKDEPLPDGDEIFIYWFEKVILETEILETVNI